MKKERQVSLMELQKVMEQRRSVRKYKEAPVKKEDLEEMVQAAILAPSWKNSQTARYHIAYSADAVTKLKTEGLAPFNAKNTEAAPVLVVNTFVKDRSGFERDGTPSNEAGQGWGFYDCGLANENFLLKACELGYGTLVMGIRDADKIREILAIPENEIIVGVIGIGVADVAPEMPKRKTIEDITKWY